MLKLGKNVLIYSYAILIYCMAYFIYKKIKIKQLRKDRNKKIKIKDFKKEILKSKKIPKKSNTKTK